MNNILWLIRREFWENRSLWIAPLAIAGVILVLTAFGGVHIGQDQSFWFGTGASDLERMSAEDREHMRNALSQVTDKREMIYAFTLSMLTSPVSIRAARVASSRLMPPRIFSAMAVSR